MEDVKIQIERLQGEKEALRTKLVGMGLAKSSDDLEACVTAVEGIADNGAVSGNISAAAGTKTAGTMVNNGAVSATIDGLTTGSYTIPAGYHDGKGTVSLTDDIANALAAI